MKLEKKVKSQFFIIMGFMFFILVVGSFWGSLVKAAERETVSMFKDISNTPNIENYDSLSIIIKAPKPFKISLRFCTDTNDYYWISYLSSGDEANYYQMKNLIEKGVENDLTLEGDWYSVKRHVPTDLDEVFFPFNFKHFDKIEIIGTNFKVLLITIFEQANELNNYHTVSNFEEPGLLSLDDPLNTLGWELSAPDCFSLEYDNLEQYLQALGPLPESENKNSSSYNYAPDSIHYSLTDYGSYYSPYSPMGGYYDNYYGSWGYGGYGLGYGYPALGGIGLGGFGLGSGYSGLGGIGLGGFGLPYSGYGSLSLPGGILGNPLLGLGFSPYTGLGLGSSSLFSGFASSQLDFSTTSNSFKAFIPRIFDVDYSTSLALSGFPITELSGITVQHTSYVPATITYY